MSCLIGQKPLGDQEKVRNQVPAGIKIWAEKKGHSLLVITGTTRSSNAGFYFRLNCFFCARFITDRKQQRGKVHMVQCKSKEVSIANADAILRQQNDEWSLEMKGRLDFVKNLLGEDTIYHETDTAVFNPAKKKRKKTGIDIGTLYLGNVGGQQLMKQMRCMSRSSNIYIRMMTNGLLSAN